MPFEWNIYTRFGIPVMMGTYGQIEQTSYVMRDAYEIWRAGGCVDWDWEKLHYMDKSIGTPTTLEQKKALPKLWQRRWKYN